MEAARTLTHPLRELKERRFTAECEALRPLGVAYVMRRFGHSLDHADAEDAVAEVIIRFHRRALAGQVPDNLRAAFFTGAHNAAIDQLRSRSSHPTVPLEAVAEAPTVAPAPEQRAELSDELVRLREAMARMRPNYREAIVLRFGLGLTVPEISERLQISLPAAKKLVLRATNQIRERMESIDGAEFCPEMRAAAQRALFDRGAAGVAEADEEAALRAHFEHCGSCRTFLAALHRNLHELGSGALFGGYAVERSGALHHLSGWVDRLTGAAHSSAERVRVLAYRAGGTVGPDGPASAGALAGTGQKLAAICTAGAATTATCLATGIVGPGIGVASAPTPVTHHQQRPVATRVHRQTPSTRRLSYEPAQPAAEVAAPEHSEPAPEASTPGHATQKASVKSKAKARADPAAVATPEPSETASEQEQSEFGFESEAPVSSSAPSEASVATASSAGSGSSSSSSPSAPSSSSPAPKGSEQFGFGG